MILVEIILVEIYQAPMKQGRNYVFFFQCCNMKFNQYYAENGFCKISRLRCFETL